MICRLSRCPHVSSCPMTDGVSRKDVYARPSSLSHAATALDLPRLRAPPSTLQAQPRVARFSLHSSLLWQYSVTQARPGISPTDPILLAHHLCRIEHPPLRHRAHQLPSS